MAKKSARAREREERLQRRNEVRGVILIALGVFLAICVYFEAIGIVGAVLTDALFGLMGLFVYALPPVLTLFGILRIVYALQASARYRAPLIVLGVYFATVLLHIIAKHVAEAVPFLQYIKEAYAYGESVRQGGGALGALLTYPLLLLIGEAGAYIFLITGILIVILLVTRLSLRETGSKVKVRVQAGIAQANERYAAKKQLYIEDLREGEEKPMFGGGKKKRPKNPVRAQENEPDIDFLPTEGNLSRRPRGRFETPAQGKRLKSIGDEDFFFESAPPEVLQSEAEDVHIDLFEEEEADPFSSPTIRELKEKEHVITPDLTVEHFSEPDDFAAIPIVQEEVRQPIAFTPPARAEEEAPPWGDEAYAPDTKNVQRPPYAPPSFSLLDPPRASYGRMSAEAPAEKGKVLIDTLESFHVKARIVNISVGPVITRFEISPAPGVRVNKITALADDIALALAAPRVRIEAPIPGKAAVGIEVPNKDTATVVLRDIVESREFISAKSPITMAIGKDIAGKIIVADLAKMPHLLIAGATGSGKSVCINDIIISLVYKCTPDELQLILVDPKVVELSAFGVLPHLKVPVVTDPKKAAGAISGGVREMTERYKKFAAVGARDLSRYNELQDDPKERLPKLVIIIDELADLMMVAPDTVEDSICRIAQLGRAAGIHLIVATQRPSADVITGLIKANIPSRIAFAVSSAIDSRIILDQGGAEKLLGRGDMLFHPNGAGKPVRAQGAYVSDEEVERIVRHFESQSIQPEYDEQLIEDMDIAKSGAGVNNVNEDELLGEAVRIVLDSGQASISMIQRRLRVGYARAARLIDIMERSGYVGVSEGSKPRKLFITRSQYEQIFGEDADRASEGYETD